ncbi:glycosyltransferase [Priestia megaterium]|uniref:glycosyltransferase n=1 Tax=Priestia megaterium TaxID=1404 RepID=UPI0014940836|nr:glycosyltransferase [Priestia megaterium]
MKENIAFIIPALTGGGAERVVANLTKGISDDYEKYIVIYHDTENMYEHNGNIINLNIGSSNNLIGKAFNTIRRIIALKKFKNKYKIDKCISFLDNPNTINVLSRSNERLFVSIRNHQSKEFNGITKKLHTLIVKKVYAKANKIIAISQGVKLDLIENFHIDPKKIEIIYNPVDIERISKLREEVLEERHQTIYKNPTIITVGRLTYQKGQWHLIRAFKKVVEKIPNAQLIILGTGSLEKELKTLINDLGLSKNVHLIGFQENPFKFIYNADLFVLPSLFEGLGNVILEAMACGTPIISTDCKSGPREILAPSTTLKTEIDKLTIEEYGILTPVFKGGILDSKHQVVPEETELSEAMVLLLKDDKLRDELKNKSIKRVNDFSFKNISEKWLDL